MPNLSDPPKPEPQRQAIHLNATDQCPITRRRFLSMAALGFAAANFCEPLQSIASDAIVLPQGGAPEALSADWFPSRMHAFVWRNWPLASLKRVAAVLETTEQNVDRAGRSMGLETPRGLSAEMRTRAAITLIRRNWHLLPYDQLLALLEWEPSQMAYALREDDFLYIKLGSIKPKCEPLRWSVPTPAQEARAAEIKSLVHQVFPRGRLEGGDPLFSFIEKLNHRAKSQPIHAPRSAKNPLRLGYSYYALYGDPLLNPELDPYPDGYLAAIAEAGVNAVWLQGVLGRLTATPWSDDAQIKKRQTALRKLTARAARHGIKIYLYLNEPRSIPVASGLFAKNPGWQGSQEGDFAALCTSSSEVRDALRRSISEICRAAPDLGGFFTITASENLTNCWSHGQGMKCPRCRLRTPAEVIAEVNGVFQAGIEEARGSQRLIVWDWGWSDWALDAIARLPQGVDLMSVSEWNLPIERGGIKSDVGEYSLSSVGPGPRALRHWEAAKKRGLGVVAKIQCAVTWEIAAVPYIPVLENVALHAQNLKNAGVDSLMLGWTLGGHPSPNLEAVREIYSGGDLDTLGRRLHGERHGPAAARFWRECSAAFREFPYNAGCVYSAPFQMGPANPLWLKPTHYAASMVGIPYDDLDAWRAIYPPDIFAAQLQKVASGMEAAIHHLRETASHPSAALEEELSFAEAAAIHYSSAANQCRFVLARRRGDHTALRELAAADQALAAQLHALQSRDSRIGFEASNQYFYIPLDLAEKTINCQWVAASADRGQNSPASIKQTD